MKAYLLTVPFAASLVFCCPKALAQTETNKAQADAQQDAASKSTSQKSKAGKNKSRYPGSALGLGPRVGPFMYIRWAEDWSDPSKAPSYKHIQLGGNPESYLTLSGEGRLRMNYTAHPGLTPAADGQDQWLLRGVVGVDAHLGSHFRAFGEVNSSTVFGHNPGAKSAQQDNDALVQQLFGEVHGQTDTADYAVRVGRQEFMDGPPAILHIRPSPNVYTTMDGISAAMNWSRFRLNAFSFKTIVLTRGGFDDSSRDGGRFSGVSTSFAAIRPAKPGDDALFVDPFAWQLKRDNKPWGARVADERRDIYGIRFWGNAGAGRYDASLIRQEGSFGESRISAWGFFSNGSLTLPGALKPQIGFHADYASGGGGFTDGTLKDFSFFYGSIPYFSWGSLVGPTNLATIAPTLRLSLSKSVQLGFEYEPLRRVSESDAVYTSQEGVYARTQTVPGKDIGALLRADLQWQANDYVQAGIRTEYLSAGDVLERAGYGSTFFVLLETQIRF